MPAEELDGTDARSARGEGTGEVARWSSRAAMGLSHYWIAEGYLSPSCVADVSTASTAVSRSARLASGGDGCHAPGNPFVSVRAVRGLLPRPVLATPLKGRSNVIMKARWAGLLLPGMLAACASLGAPPVPAPPADRQEAPASGDLEVLELDQVGSAAGEGRVLVRVRNGAPHPVILGVDVRAEPGLWLAPARQETSLFYVPPRGERTVIAQYAFARLSPEAALRVRVGVVEEHADGRFHVPEPVAVRRFDLGASGEAAAFLDRFDTRVARNVTIHAVRGMLTPAQLDGIAAERERAIDELARMLNVQPPPGLRIVFYPDGPSKTADTYHVGNGLTRGNTIVEIRNDSVRLDPYHELAHLMSGQLGWAPAWLNEGFAVWATERLGADALEFIVSPGKTVDHAVCDLERAGDLLPVADLLRLPDIGPEESRPHITYPQAASFVGFLAERFSLEALRRAYATVTPAATDEEKEAAFAQAFGVTSIEAAELWTERLRRTCPGGDS
jgi:hypothetical protein